MLKKEGTDHWKKDCRLLLPDKWNERDATYLSNTRHIFGKGRTSAARSMNVGRYGMPVDLTQIDFTRLTSAVNHRRYCSRRANTIHQPVPGLNFTLYGYS